VSVVVPTINEAKNLPHVFERIPPGVFEIIVVDGGSVDGTIDVARGLRNDIRVLRQPGRGKGNALLHAFAACRGDVVVAIDADGSTDPAEIPAFVATLLAGADFAKGSRFASGAGSSDITPMRRHGNRVLQRMVNALYGTRYTDLCYGYNAFWARHLTTFAPARERTENCRRHMRLGDGFEIETLINVRIAKVGLRVVEVPSYEGERIHGSSRLNAARDGLRALRVITVEWRRPNRWVDADADTELHVRRDADHCAEHAAWGCCCAATASA
ncbi:MAG: glycosyltransferase family 2 protein, partial [Actinobacteria bacterium]|nr:glycosyltransferase family 2 protein [Actinomycetota bacterium]